MVTIQQGANSTDCALSTALIATPKPSASFASTSYNPGYHRDLQAYMKNLFQQSPSVAHTSELKIAQAGH